MKGETRRKGWYYQDTVGPCESAVFEVQPQLKRSELSVSPYTEDFSGQIEISNQENAGWLRVGRKERCLSGNITR